jgi:hypothetical protein
MLTYNANLTDTFGGERNYAWLRTTMFKAEPTAENKTLLQRALELLEADEDLGNWEINDLPDGIEAFHKDDCVAVDVTWVDQ